MVAAAIGGAAVLGAGASIYSGNKAAGAAKDAAGQSADVQRYIYDQTRADQAPWRQIGQGALAQLGALYGIQSAAATNTQPGDDLLSQFHAQAMQGKSWGDEDRQRYNKMISDWQAQQPTMPQSSQLTALAGGAPDYSQFYQTPDYQVRLQEGNKAIDRSAAARGTLYSGGTLKALSDYNADSATKGFGDYVNHLSALAGVGQSATNAVGAAGQSYAANTGNALTNAGNAQASAYANTGSSIASLLGDGAMGYGYYMKGKT